MCTSTFLEVFKTWVRNPLTVEFILTKQVLAWCHGGWATGGCGGGGWVAGKGTGHHLLVVDQAPSDFSRVTKLPPTVTAVPGGRKAWGQPEGTCGDITGQNSGKYTISKGSFAPL